MILPKPPEPAMVYINAVSESTRCHNETQLIEYGLACALAMREACAAVVQSNADVCDDGSLLQVYLASNAAAIKALEIVRTPEISGNISEKIIEHREYLKP